MFSSVTGLLLLAGVVRADVLLDATNLIGLPTVAPPALFPFTTTTAEALTVTLTDFQQPAAFGTLQIAVTLGDTLVGSGTVDATTHTVTVAVPAATGNYVLHVVGTPDATQGIGSFGACVTRNSDPTPRTCIPAYSYSGNLQTPAAASTLPSSALNANFTSTGAGVYTVTITDDLFPAPLQSVTGGITTGSTAVNAIPFALGSNQVTLAAGTTYTLVLGALADANLQAGLYSVHIVDSAGAAVFDRTLPVGTLTASTLVNVPAAQPLSLTLNDLGYPAALANAGVAATAGSSLLGSVAVAGTVAIAAPAGNVELWRYVTASSDPGVYTLNLSTGAGTALYSTAQVVTPGTPATAQSFAFVQNLTAAGTYTLLVTDFNFPAALAGGPSATVAQNGAVLTQSSGGQFTAAAGYIVVLVTAAPPSTSSGSGSGIFGVTLQTSGSTPQVIFDQTQSVGAVFSTQAVALTAAGTYDVTLADLKFPEGFQSLGLVVSQGSQVLGKIFGGGSFQFAGTPGSYVLTFIDTPSATVVTATDAPGYGLYSVRVASSAPAITFSASASTVTSGKTVDLTWSTTNATACTAAGTSSWNGTVQLSGTQSVAITTTSALTLTCTGPGGSATQSVSVTATAAPAASSSGGGGSVDWPWLLLLGSVLILEWSRRLAGSRRADAVVKL